MRRSCTYCVLTHSRQRNTLRAAVEKAEQIGVPVHIAVMDAGAHLKAFLRMDGAVLGSLDIALTKPTQKPCKQELTPFGIKAQT
jgi:uncharacterized protein GlcG (DUF336 family)